MELPIEGCRFRELDSLVTSDAWLDEQAHRLCGWEILVRTCRAERIEPMGLRELCDKVGYPRVVTTVERLRTAYKA